MWAAPAPPKKLGMVISRLVKSIPPRTTPTTGIIRSLTKELMILLKAPPTITPTARSRTLPRLMKSRNSLRMGLTFVIFFFSFFKSVFKSGFFIMLIINENRNITTAD